MCYSIPPPPYRDPLAHIDECNALLRKIGIRLALRRDFRNEMVSWWEQLVGEEPVIGGITYEDKRWHVHTIYKRQPSGEQALHHAQELFWTLNETTGILKTPKALIYMNKPILFVISLAENIIFERPEDLDALGQGLFQLPPHG